jgi:hypothetical protein
MGSLGGATVREKHSEWLVPAHWPSVPGWRLAVDDVFG